MTPPKPDAPKSLLEASRRTRLVVVGPVHGLGEVSIVLTPLVHVEGLLVFLLLLLQRLPRSYGRIRRLEGRRGGGQGGGAGDRPWSLSLALDEAFVRQVVRLRWQLLLLDTL